MKKALKKAQRMKKRREMTARRRAWRKIGVSKDIIHKVMIKVDVIKRKHIGEKDWWGKSCTKQKRMVQRCYKKWRKGKIGWEEYIEIRKGLKEFLGKK